MVLYFGVIGPRVSYLWIRSMTRTYSKLEYIGTEIVDEKFIISNPKEFLPHFVIFSIIGLPIVIAMFLWIIIFDRNP